MTDAAVAVINASTVLGDDEVSAIVPALQKQVSEHLSLVWGTDASLSFIPRGGAPPEGTWWLSVLDNSDQAGAEGYHDITDEGLPLGKVFAGTDMANGFTWTVTASHELLEMLVDPDINRAVFVRTDNNNLFYAYEICDQCEMEQDGYLVDGVLVSDFVFPSWFQSLHAPGRTQFDVMQKITQPFELLAGGYISVYNVGSGNGWQQLNAAAMPQGHRARAPVGSRRERRRVSRQQWLRSTIRR
jgi:hypothetical protein